MKNRISLADHDIAFLVLSRLRTVKPWMTLNEIKCCLLDEHAHADCIDYHQLILKKVKWKYFLLSYVEPKERV